MRQDDAFDISQLFATEAIAAGELNRIEPELRRVVTAILGFLLYSTP